MRPKIIFTVTNDLSYDQRMIRICTTLAAHDFEVELIGRNKPNSVPLITQKFQQKRFNLWFTRGKLFYLAYNIQLFFFLLFSKFDIIGSVDLDTLLPCFLVAKIKGKPCVFDAHEYFTEVPEVVDRPFTKATWEAVGNWIIPRLSYAYTVSATLQALFSKKYGIPFDLIRNIAEAKESFNFEPSETQKPIILYQGVLNEGRGLENLLGAMTAIDNAELWLAGEGDLSNQLRRLASELKVTQNVKFLGYLPPKELSKITTQATIGVNLLENKGLSYYYSLANKTFDYIHAEVPAIHMDFPEYRAINQKCQIGLLIDNLAQNTIVTAIQQLLNDQDLYNQLKRNCRAAKKVYNWEKEAQKLVKIYQNLFLADD
ncbi:MAG: glycosyltransferase [Bacteroidota bacterium]